MRGSIEAFVDRHGALYLVRPGADDLVVRRPDPIDVALIARLARGPGTAGDLLASLRADGLAADDRTLARKLASLVEADALTVRRPSSAPPLGEHDADRFSRQLPYLAEYGDERLLQHRLRAASVCVIGCGGLGTWVIAALAATGIGRLVLVDHDTVELSNLNRQVLYGHDDVGRPKADVAAGWIRAFDPAIEASPVREEVAAEADVAPLVAGSDVVVLAADQPPYEIARWVNAACVESRTPFVVAGQVPPIVKVGPTYVPGAGPCFACHESALRRESCLYDDYVASRQHGGHAIAGTLGPASGLAGSLIGLELLHLLIGRMPVTGDRAVIIDIRTLEMRHEAVTRDPGCNACGHLG